MLVFFPKEESGSENHFRLCGERKNLRKLDPDFAAAARQLLKFDCYEPVLVFLDFVNLLLLPIHRGQRRIYHLDFDLDRQGAYQAEPPRKVHWSPGLLNPDYCNLYQHLQFKFKRNPDCLTEEDFLATQRKREYVIQWFVIASYRDANHKTLRQLIKNTTPLPKPVARTQWKFKTNYASRSISHAGSYRSQRSTYSQRADQDFPLRLQDIRHGPPSERAVYYHSIIRVQSQRGKNIITDVLATSTLNRQEIAQLPEDFGQDFLRYGNQSSPERLGAKRNRPPSPDRRDFSRRRN